MTKFTNKILTSHWDGGVTWNFQVRCHTVPDWPLLLIHDGDECLLDPLRKFT